MACRIGSGSCVLVLASYEPSFSLPQIGNSPEHGTHKNREVNRLWQRGLESVVSQGFAKPLLASGIQRTQR